jgi:hypothetical protein
MPEPFQQQPTRFTPFLSDRRLAWSLALRAGLLIFCGCVGGFLAAVVQAEVVKVPASIPTGLEQDVTGALNEFLRSVPNGATVEFPEQAVYRIEGTLLLNGCRGLTLEGHGATFQATDPLPDYEKAKNSAEWRRVRTRSQWRIDDSQDVVLRNMRVIGAHKHGGREGEYDANREAQHAFDVLGVKGVLIEAVQVSDVFGDGIYISGGSRDVTVRRSRIQRTGRQGMAIGSAHGILIEENDVRDSRRGLLDIEPYGKQWSCGDVRVIGNHFGDSRLLALPMGGSGAIGAVLVANNTFEGPNGSPLVLNRTKSAGVKRGPFFFVGNSGQVGGSPAPGLRFGEVSGVLIAGNRLAFSAQRNMSVLSTETGPTGVFGNRFPGAARLADDAVMPLLTERANTFGEGAASPAEVKVIAGGYAVKVKLSDELECVGVMRADEESEIVLEAFGLKTKAQWAWELRSHDEVVESAAAR